MRHSELFDLSRIDTVYGVDFSGARLAGENAWVARVESPFAARPKLAALDNLGVLAGTAERSPALGHLVSSISASDKALWAIDFPFALPVELFDPGTGLAGQLDLIAAHTGTAMTWGRSCVATCQQRLGRMHVRRQTDTESRSPFDCYHYRIVHQTYHGMREVLRPLLADAHTAILPFHSPDGARRFVVEACPSSTLKRLGLPHQNYKQTTPGSLTPKRLATRKALYAALHDRLEIPAALQRLISRNPGGDALDAVLAALGAMHAMRTYDPATIAAHPRYPREGMIFF